MNKRKCVERKVCLNSSDTDHLSSFQPELIFSLFIQRDPFSSNFGASIVFFTRRVYDSSVIKSHCTFICITKTELLQFRPKFPFQGNLRYDDWPTYQVLEIKNASRNSIKILWSLKIKTKINEPEPDFERFSNLRFRDELYLIYFRRTQVSKLSSHLVQFIDSFSFPSCREQRWKVHTTKNSV